MMIRNNATVHTEVVFTEQLPRAVEFRVEMGTNQEMTLLERSKKRSRDCLLFRQ